MAQWANYLISRVRFNLAGTHIDQVEVYTDNGNALSYQGTMERTEVVKRLENEETFMTIYKNADGTWKQGRPVKIVTIYGVKYIKTYADGTTKDNLDDLPRF